MRSDTHTQMRHKPEARNHFLETSEADHSLLHPIVTIVNLISAHILAVYGHQISYVFVAIATPASWQHYSQKKSKPY